MKKLEIPTFDTVEDLFKFLKDNKQTLESQKKAEIKHADGSGLLSTVLSSEKIEVSKSSGSNSEEGEFITVKAIINTTNILDSHGDVHIKGLWNKSIKENKRILHVQEHKSREFDKIISSGNDLKATVKTYSWKELGVDAEGETQALVFTSKVRKERNPFMYEQYSKGYVDNHSVGMRYVKIELAVNSEKDYYEEEKAIWDKYIDQIVNKQDAENQGYFWVVLEAKAIEGSAVPLGSNPITPTMNIKSEPSLKELINNLGIDKNQDTRQEKAAESTFDILGAIQKTNFNL